MTKLRGPADRPPRPDSRIRAAVVDTLLITLQEEYRTHTRQILEHQTIWMKLRSGPHLGHGEAFAYSIEEPLGELRGLRLEGASVWDSHRILEEIQHPAARAAVDIALLDLTGKILQLPLGRLLGLPRRVIPTALSFGIQPEGDLLRKLREWRRYGIRTFKLKIGRETEASLLRGVRRELGSDAEFWVDANQGWDDAMTRRLGPILGECGVLFVEQPLPIGQLAEYESLRRALGVPIFLDEEIRTVADVVAAAKHGGIDGVNVKLSKCGGVRDALRLIAVARAHGFKILLGCFFEGPIAISAAAHLQGLADYVDLDACLYVRSKPNFRGAIYEGAHLRPPSDSGHGARLSDCTGS